MSLKTFLAGAAFVAAAYFVAAYDVEIKVKETAAAADCNPSNPACGN